MRQIGFNSPRDFPASTVIVTGNSAGGLVAESAAPAQQANKNPSDARGMVFFMGTILMVFGIIRETGCRRQDWRIAHLYVARHIADLDRRWRCVVAHIFGVG